MRLSHALDFACLRALRSPTSITNADCNSIDAAYMEANTAMDSIVANAVVNKMKTFTELAEAHTGEVCEKIGEKDFLKRIGLVSSTTGAPN